MAKGRRALENERAPREPREGKSSTKKYIIIAAIVLVLISPLLWYALSVSPAARGNDEIVEVTIPLGSGARDIARILSENDIIRNETAFLIHVRLRGEMNFQAGTYGFKQSMGVREITDILQTGRLYSEDEIEIRFLEGITLWRMAREIEEQTNNTEEDVFNLLADEEYIVGLIERFWFLTDEITNPELFYPLEGYLFPDTYRFRNKDISVEEIFEAMLVRMGQVLENYREEIEASQWTVHEIITVASVLETEGNSEEAAMYIASIIYNRLDVGMPLGMDPTAYYAIRVHPAERAITLAELNRFSPFNTRGPNMGGRLPVGPIATVSRNSIRAAVRPADTNYLFFVSDSSNRLYFRETYAGHRQIIRELQEQGIWHVH